MHKICMCCAAVSKMDANHCGMCGEADWLPMNDFPMTTPSFYGKKPDDKGRK